MAVSRAILVAKSMTSPWAQGLLLNGGVALVFFGIVNLFFLSVFASVFRNDAEGGATDSPASGTDDSQGAQTLR